MNSRLGAKKNEKAKKRKRYGSYFWIDPKTKLGYAKVQIVSGERDAKNRLKYKTILKRADTLTEADQIAQDLIRENSLRGPAFLDGRQMTFEKLAEWYKTEFAVAPVYVGGKKIAGMRTWEAERNKIDRLVKIFGRQLIEDIDEFMLRRYKIQRFKSEIKPSSVNRDFETIRAILRKAAKKKWLKELPDFSGLIDKSLEDRRTVTITNAQEAEILRVAKTLSHAPRLYALIIALRDTGARPSELYPVNDYETDYANDAETKFEPLRWRDVRGANGEIKDIARLVSYKGKIREERLCVITERLKSALLELWDYLQSGKARNTLPERKAKPENLIFPHTTYKKSWDNVRDETGYKDLRLRDLRRDWSTRLARLGYSDRLAQRGMGHKQLQQTFAYTEFDLAAALQAKEMLDRENSAAQKKGDHQELDSSNN